MKKRIIQITIYCLMSGFVLGQTLEVDPSFGEEGFVIFEEETIHEIEVQTNGKIIVLGEGLVYGFDINGKPDMTFADNGILNIPVDTICSETSRMTLLPDDNHIVFFSQCIDSTLHLFTYDIQNSTILEIVQFVPDNMYCNIQAISDTEVALSTMNSDTIIIVDIFGQQFSSIDNEIPVPNNDCSVSMYYGYSDLYTRGFSDFVNDSSFFYISKIGDSTFAENGVYTELRGNIPSNFLPNAEKILIQSDGKVLYGSSQPTFAGKRLLTDGTPDLTFNDIPFPLESSSDGNDFQDFTVAPNDEIFVALKGGFFPTGYVVHYDKNGNELGYIMLPNEEITVGIKSIVAQQNHGVLVATIMNNSGQTNTEIIRLIPTTQYVNFVSGNVFNDLNIDCTQDSLEQGLKHWLVKLEGAYTTYDVTNSLGHYHVGLLGTGDFKVSVIPPNYLWGAVCPADTIISINADSTTTTIIDFALEPTVVCPLLEIDISSPILRRCFESTYHVSYCNSGTAIAENAYVEIQLDPFFTYENSSIAATDLGENLYAFDLGNIGIGECDNFQIEVYVDCDSTVIGQTHCVEAHIYPDSICIPIDPLWDESSIMVNAECLGDSIEFIIENIGIGDMSDSLEYMVIEEDLIWHRTMFKLESGDDLRFSKPANGAFHRLETEQSPGHPGNSMPSVFVEGCGTDGNGEFSLGFVNYYVLDEGNAFVSIDCQENVGSYDPNDKQAFPVGVGDQHYITNNTDLEYLIRFQNTGTDTAFNIVIRDTISSHLNIETLHPGVASHPYRYDIEDSNVAVFHFENIMLPDSDVNEATSHGFVKFNIQQQANNPVGTVLENKASIYFDFNTPIITNAVTHTIDETYFTNVSIVTPPEVDEAGITVNVFPNPFDEYTIFKVEGGTVSELHLDVYDIMGRKVLQQQNTNQSFIALYKNNLPPGVYVFRLMDEKQPLATGKLVVK